MNPLQLVVGFLLSLLIACLGYRGRALAPSGVAGAILVGTPILGLGGWTWGLLLIAFFLSSSLLSRYREGEKRGLAEKFAKVGGRDLGQALANGGWGALLAVVHAFRPHPLLFTAFVGAMAAVNADTWATELGVLSPTPPRLITTGQKVPVGTPGGVSSLGLSASLAGALLIGLLALILERLAPGGNSTPSARWLPVAASLGGLTGSLLDSLLGATVQGIYYCEACGKETESRVHRCGATTRQVRGWRWLDNDGVNLLSSVVGSVVAGVVGGFAR
ncbi:MAG TPA: DUF92 domain-containing protein [Anaerolineae bacterium]|nr:DUF92 domain-containing protein [Anaerolineae bacterium]